MAPNKSNRKDGSISLLQTNPKFKQFFNAANFPDLPDT